MLHNIGVIDMILRTASTACSCFDDAAVVRHVGGGVGEVYPVSQVPLLAVLLPPPGGRL